MLQKEYKSTVAIFIFEQSFSGVIPQYRGKYFEVKHLLLYVKPDDINFIDFKKMLQQVFGSGFIPWIHRMQTKDQTRAIREISCHALKFGLAFCGLDIDQETK